MSSLDNFPFTTPRSNGSPSTYSSYNPDLLFLNQLFFIVNNPGLGSLRSHAKGDLSAIRGGLVLETIKIYRTPSKMTRPKTASIFRKRFLFFFVSGISNFFYKIILTRKRNRRNQSADCSSQYAMQVQV